MLKANNIEVSTNFLYLFSLENTNAAEGKLQHMLNLRLLLDNLIPEY